jgi:stage V sporulation protein D (sporulation-specific penicillin-binding protein)
VQFSEQKRKWRILWVFFITCALFFALVVRTFFLQIVQGNWLVEKALSQWTRKTAVSASRGVIYDRNGEVLAQSGSADSVVLHPKAINKSKNAAENEAAAMEVARNLSAILEMDEQAIYTKARDTTKYEIWLKRQITEDQSARIKALGLNGVSLAVDTKRYYPKGDFLTQVLGFTSIDGVGIEGLEYYYNRYLTGTSGSITSQTDVRGNEVAFAEQFYVPATDGYNAYLTIDFVIQSIVEKAAQDAYERYNAKGIMCVAMDPNTGAILALTNRPGYDLNAPPREDMEALIDLTRNHVLVDAHDPGSVFKVFTLAAALDTGAASESNHFNCNGGRQLAGGFVRCASNHGHNISLATGLARSCNSVFMDLALRLGTDRLYSYIRNFGFGAKTAVDFPSEASGILIPEASVKEGDLARIGFGQSITTTPLQTLSAFCAIINGGNLLTPHLLSRIENDEGDVVEKTETTVVRRVISEQTSARMKALLENVVTNGSGSRSAIVGYTVGGKTGTAQKYDESGTIKNVHLSSFIAFAPVEDPKIAILFLVDEAQMDNAYGSQVAAPYVGQILEQALPYLGVEPTYTQQELDQMGSVQVPDVIGMEKAQAQTALTQKGLLVYLSGSEGTVVEQMPAAGEVVRRGETVAITLKTREELGPVEMVDVPNLMGKTIEECRDILDGLGLNFYAHGEGKAIWQNIKPGNQVEIRTQIRVEFSQ